MLAANWGPVETTMGVGISEIRSSHPETVKVMLAAGADVNGENAAGKTALAYAQEQANAEVVGLLESRY